MPKRTNDGISKRCDCARRIWPKCIHPWHFNFHTAGKQYRFSLEEIARREGARPPAHPHRGIRVRQRPMATPKGP